MDTPSVPRVPLGDGSVSAAERQRRLREDYDWAWHDAVIARRYGGQTVVVYDHRILCSGANLDEAMQATRKLPDCPPERDLTLVVLPLCVAAEGTEYAWCLRNEAVQERYGGLVAAIQGQRVLGAGTDRSEALTDARAQQGAACPPEDALDFVLIPCCFQPLHA